MPKISRDTHDNYHIQQSQVISHCEIHHHMTCLQCLDFLYQCNQHCQYPCHLLQQVRGNNFIHTSHMQISQVSICHKVRYLLQLLEWIYFVFTFKGSVGTFTCEYIEPKKAQAVLISRYILYLQIRDHATGIAPFSDSFVTTGQLTSMYVRNSLLPFTS